MLDTLEKWNVVIFHWINGSASSPFPVKALALLSAEALIYVLAAWLILSWVRGNHRIRTWLLYGTVSVLMSLAVNQVIGFFWYHPRPFEMGIGHALASHAVETSFPSDHAVVFFSLGFALLGNRETRHWGLTISLAGTLVAWSRVYLGIHFPLDMIGAVAVSLASATITHLGLPLIERLLEPFLTTVYEHGVRLLHLPAAWFPCIEHEDRRCRAPKPGRQA